MTELQAGQHAYDRTVATWMTWITAAALIAVFLAPNSKISGSALLLATLTLLALAGSRRVIHREGAAEVLLATSTALFVGTVVALSGVLS